MKLWSLLTIALKVVLILHMTWLLRRSVIGDCLIPIRLQFDLYVPLSQCFRKIYFNQALYRNHNLRFQSTSNRDPKGRPQNYNPSGANSKFYTKSTNVCSQQKMVNFLLNKEDASLEPLGGTLTIRFLFCILPMSFCFCSFFFFSRILIN